MTGGRTWLWCALLLGLCAAGSAHAGPDDRVVLVARRGWHIDVGIVGSDLDATLKADTAAVQARYDFFGFGDRRYLTSKHRLPAMIAALWPGRGVILLTGINATPQQAFGADEVIALRLTPERLDALQKFLAQSIERHNDGADSLGPGPYDGSWYFESTQRYSGVHTCNTWAAEALRAAGFPLRSRGILLAGQLWRQMKRLKAREPSVAL